MTTDLTKTQLNTILSALDGKPRNPNTKDAALKAIGRHAEASGISINDILAAADGLLEGRANPGEFRASLQPEATKRRERKSAPTKKRDGTKQAAMIALLRRPEGATIDQIVEITGWKRHYADVRIMPTCACNPACGAGIAAMGAA